MSDTSEREPWESEAWLESVTAEELRRLAKERGIAGVGKLRKAELVERLRATSGAEEVRPGPDEEGAAPTVEAPEEVREAPERAPRVRRTWIAVPLRLIGGLGLITALGAMLWMPFLMPKAVAQVKGAALLTADQVRAVGESLSLAGQSLDMAAGTLDSTAAMMDLTEELLGESEPLLDSVGAFVGDDAATTIEATQSSLESAQAAAGTIDVMMRALRVFGPLSGVQEGPETSLSESLAEVEGSLEPLPGTLREMQRELSRARENLSHVRPALESMARDLEDFGGSVEEMAADIQTQAQEVAQAAEGAERLAARLDGYGRWAVGLLELLLGWIAVGQLSVFLLAGVIDRG